MFRNRKRKRKCPQRKRLTAEQFEPRYCLSAIGFAPHDIVIGDARGASDVKTADIDGDGDLDVLSASIHDDKIAWYENTDGRGAFGGQQVITTSARSAWSVYAADLNGDGNSDVLSASSGDDTVDWYENRDGRGAFGEQQLITTSALGAFSVYAGDVDGDGDLDVLSASLHDVDQVAWHENTDGQGTFGPRHLSAGDEPSAVTSADLNGEGLLDVIVADRQSTLVSVLQATDDGAFADRLQFNAGRPASSVATGDVDGDGTSDLIIAGGEGQRAGFSVLRNNGTGSDGWLGLETAVAYATGDRPVSIIAKDFDTDGHVDVAVGNAEDVSVRLGNGDGTFADPIGYLPGAGSRSLAAGDLNADGHLDLAVSNGDSALVSILLGSGDGTFEPHDQAHALGTPGQRGPWSLAIADFDRNGALDLAVARDDSYGGNLAILLGKGDGSFDPEPVKSTIVGSPATIASGDIDEDGNLDLVVSCGGIFHDRDYGNASGGMLALLGNGDGSFDLPIRLLTDEGKQTVHLTDMDGDTRLDILTDGQRGALELRGTRNTIFERELATFVAGARASWATAGDFDGDGDVDLSVTNQDSGDVSLLWGAPDAPFTQAARHPVGVSPGAQVAVDLNADGQLDLAVVNRVSNNVSILSGTGNGSFLQEVRYDSGESPNSLAAADVNGDANLDLVVANTATNDLSVFLGRGDGTLATQPRVSAGEAPQSVIAHDLNADGHVDLVVANRWSGHVTVRRGNGDGTFGAKTAYRVDDDAVAVVWADFDVDGHADLAVAS